MKLSGGAIERFLKSPDPAIRAVLIYGPDEGLVRERLDRLAKTVVSDLKDPFRVCDLTADDLKDDPARLSDEAAALSFGGGRRLVRLRHMADTQTARIKPFVENPVGDALVLVQGGELGPRSSLRKLFEGSPAAAALPCYADEGQGLDRLVRDILAQANVSADAEAVDYLVSHLGGDRGVTRVELSKLITYLGDKPRITLADAEACVGDTAQIGQETLTLAVADGDAATALRALDRLHSEGVATVAILRTLIRHFTRLHLVSGLVAGGQTLDKAMSALKPPPLFKVAPRFRTQVNRWPVDRLAQALDILLEAERDSKSVGLPDKALVDRTVMRLANAAQAKSRR